MKEASEHSPSRIALFADERRQLSNEALAIETTKYMVRNLEWSGVVFQIATLLASALIDPYSPGNRAIILALAVLHIPIVFLYLRGYGPFALGGAWILIYPVQVVSVNILMAVIAPPETYGAMVGCVPGCNYSASMWLFLAYYPWLPHFRGIIRISIEIGLLLGYYFLFIILIFAKNTNVTAGHIQSATTSLMWLVVGYVLGKAVQKMCVAAAEKQLEVQQRNYWEFFDFLHSHVKAGIATVRVDVEDPSLVMEKLNQLEDVVGEYRIELLLAQERVPVAALLSERIRTFRTALGVSTPRVGPLTVDRPIGITIGRALGDLLKNSTMYGARGAAVEADITPASITLRVIDDGPGFDDGILDDESRSLHRLRCAAESLGGTLTKFTPENGHGSVMALHLPLRVAARQRGKVVADPTS